MAFNVGGTNVGGVKAVESGVLSIVQQDSSFSVGGGESVNTDFSPPSGEIWVLKSMAWSIGDFVGTMAGTSINIRNDTSGLFIPLYAATTAQSGSINLPQPITIEAGTSVRYINTTSAWTSGQLKLKFAYQKILK